MESIYEAILRKEKRVRIDEMVLTFLAECPGMSCAAIARAIHQGDKVAAGALRRLLKAGKVKRAGGSLRTKWRMIAK